MKKVPIYGIQEFGCAHEVSSFYANDLRIHLEEHKFVNTHHRHSTYVCVYFTKGTGKHVIDFETYNVKPGSVFFLNPGQVHCWSLSEDVAGFVFFHTKDFFEGTYLKIKLDDFPFFGYGQNTPVVYLDQEKQVSIESYFQHILDEKNLQLELRNIKIVLLLSLVYIELSRCCHDGKVLKSHQHYGHINRFLELVDAQYKNIKLPNLYAEQMHITTRHLSRICAEMLNATPTEIILNRVVVEAKRMLINKNTSIIAIAEELGYDDYSYFIRLFKKKTGETPKQFLRLLS